MSNVCPICQSEILTIGKNDIAYLCGYYVGVDGEFRTMARCSNVLKVVRDLRTEVERLTQILIEKGIQA